MSPICQRGSWSSVAIALLSDGNVEGIVLLLRDAALALIFTCQDCILLRTEQDVLFRRDDISDKEPLTPVQLPADIIISRLPGAALAGVKSLTAPIARFEQ